MVPLNIKVTETSLRDNTWDDGSHPLHEYIHYMHWKTSYITHDEDTQVSTKDLFKYQINSRWKGGKFEYWVPLLCELETWKKEPAVSSGWNIRTVLCAWGAFTIEVTEYTTTLQRCQTHEPKPNKHTQWALSLILYSGRFHPVLQLDVVTVGGLTYTLCSCVCDGGPIKWSHGQLCPLHHPIVPMATSDKLLAMPSAIWKNKTHEKKSLIQQGHYNAVAVEHTKEINIQKGNKEHEEDHRNKLSTNETEHWTKGTKDLNTKGD